MQKRFLTFDKVNSIVYKEPQYKLCDLKPFLKPIEIRVIVLSLEEKYTTKNSKKVSKFLVADQSGSAWLNCYDDGSDVLLTNLI